MSSESLAPAPSGAFACPGTSCTGQRSFGMNRPNAISMFAVLLGAMVTMGPAAAGGFGFTAGAPIEERMGSEYGAEYYHRDARVAQPRSHHRFVRAKTRTAGQQRRGRIPSR